MDVRAMAQQMKDLDDDTVEAKRLRQLTEPRENAFLKLNTNSTQLVFGKYAYSTHVVYFRSSSYPE